MDIAAWDGMLRVWLSLIELELVALLKFQEGNRRILDDDNDNERGRAGIAANKAMQLSIMPSSTSFRYASVQRTAFQSSGTQ